MINGVFRKKTAGNQAVRQVSGPSRRPSGTSLKVWALGAGPRAWGQAPRPGLRLMVWGGGPRAWGRKPQVGAPGLGLGRQGLGARPQTEPCDVVLKRLLVRGWQSGGSQLKRLPQMWGPGGKPPNSADRSYRFYNPKPEIPNP